MDTIEEMRLLGDPEVVMTVYSNATRNICQSDRLILETNKELPQDLREHPVMVYAHKLFWLIKELEGSHVCRT